MSGFDVDAWAAAQEPWTMTMGGDTFVARPVSAAAVIRAQMEMQGAGTAAVRRIVRRVFREAFPRTTMMWLGKRPDPVVLIEQLPLAGWEAIVASFFGYATGKSSRTTPVPSPLTSSPPPSTVPPAMGSGLPPTP